MCVILCNFLFWTLSIVYELQCFENWILISSSGRKGDESKIHLSKRCNLIILDDGRSQKNSFT
jgi:hypothetical protein